MAVRYVDAIDLADILRSPGPGDPVVALVGAGVSSVVPTRLPFADAWKQALLPLIAEAAGAPLGWRDAFRLLGAMMQEGDRSKGLRLEALFQSCERNDPHGRLGTTLALATEEAREPNELHTYLAGALADGRIAAVITTNWDTLLETAFEQAAGRKPRTWIVGQPWVRDAELFKLHGCQSDPTSLRHTLATINQRFPAEVVDGIRSLTARRIVALGYAGADFDVQDLISNGRDAYWLHRYPTEDLRSGHALTEPGATRVAEKRDVAVVGGGFESLLTALGRPWHGIDGSATVIARWTADVMHGVTAPVAAAILLDCLFRLAVTVPNGSLATPGFTGTIAELDDATLAWLKSQQRLLGRTLWQQHRAARLQHQGHGGRASLIYLRLAADRAARAHAISDAADCAERIAFGLLPFQRVLTLPAHRYGARHDSDPWLRARYARSVAATGRQRRAIRLLDELLSEGPHDTFVEAHIRRRNALALAILGETGWQDELSAAAELFAFEERSLEVAAVYRTQAAYLYLVRQAADAEAALAISDALNVHRGSRVRNAVMRCALRLPVLLGRPLIGLLYG